MSGRTWNPSTHALSMWYNLCVLDRFSTLVVWKKTHRTFELNECNVIYGWHSDTQFKDVLNYATLVAKYLIFCCFQDNTAVTFDRFLPFLSNQIDNLRQIALKNKQLEEFNKKWKNFIWAFFFLFCFVSFWRLHFHFKCIFLSSSFSLLSILCKFNHL